MFTKNLSVLKIHKLTQAQYDRELAAGNIEENALYLTPEEEKAAAVHASQHASGGSDPIAPADIGAVPTTRKVNGKKLSSDITLTASDVNAVTEKRGAASLSQVGWYRLATFVSQSRTNMVLVMFGNNYQSSKLYPQGVTALVNANTYQPAIVVLGSSESNVFSKLRLVNIGTTKMALEAYYAATNTNNVYSAITGVRTDNDFAVDNFATPTEEDIAVAMEQDLGIVPSGNVLTDGMEPADFGAVPATREINGKVLSSNITLGASDVGAVPTTRKVNGKALSSDITLGASDVSAVPTSRTINGNALSSDITLTASDVGAIALTDKPTGTYTGGGTKTIATGGKGNVLIIVASPLASGDSYKTYIVHPLGAAGITGNSANSTHALGPEDVKYENGTLTIASDAGVSGLSMSGVTYAYYCL